MSTETLTRLHPWHAKPSAVVQSFITEKRLPHALLLTGALGLGQRVFAEVFAQSLLCASPSAPLTLCGHCLACHWMMTGVHPDFRVLSPEKPGSAIAVDVVREAIQYVNETAAQGGYKILVIDPATAMNTASANALLKTLEEPPSHVVIMLIADQSLALPATILSRCQRIVFPKAQIDEALPWLQARCPEVKSAGLLLKLAGGAPVLAETWHAEGRLALRARLYDAITEQARERLDPLQFALDWQNEDPLMITELWMSLVSDLMRLVTVPNADCENEDYRDKMVRLTPRYSTNKLTAFWTYLVETRSILQAAVALNKQLLLESLIIRWGEYAAS